MSGARLIPGADPRPREILHFWFGAAPDRVPAVLQRRWFARDPVFDAEILTRFIAYYHEAFDGNLEDWRRGPLHSLAYVILLDQFPRNMFRDTAKAFAADPFALAAARDAVRLGFDREVPPLARAFFYLPFGHSEALADQDEGVHLLAQWEAEPDLVSYVQHARRRRQIIERFGRFPHRNAQLWRASTPEEIEFLAERGSAY